MADLTGWEGLDTLEVARLLEEMKPDAEARVMKAGAYFAGQIKVTLSGPRHGRWYIVPSQARGKPAKRRRRPRRYQASAPGEAPAVLFGNLRNSIGFSRPIWDGMTVMMLVGVGLGQPPKGGADPATSYARILEWGGMTAKGVRILPRPYMEPTALRCEERIERILAGDTRAAA